MPRPTPVRHRDGRVSWRVRFRLDGGGNPVNETFETQDEAARFARLVERVGGTAARQARDLSTTAATSTPTTAAAVEEHLTALAASATPGTVRHYRSMARDWITPQLGTMPVDMLTRRTIEGWIAWMRTTPTRTGLPPSAKTMKNVQGLLSAVLQRQVDADTIPKNVAKGAPLPTDAQRREMRLLTPSEVAVLAHATDDYWRPLVLTLYGLGCRFGEATALTPADLDLEAVVPTVRIRRAWKEGQSAPYLGSTKTRRGTRTVSIPASLVPVLREQARGLQGDALLFTSRRGGPVRSSTFHEDAWRPAVERAGLFPRPRVHDLRHSCASALIAAGTPLPEIQQRLGHESIQTTVDTYGHLMPDALVRTATAMDLAMVQALPQIEG